jgi:hypothetical protein
MASGDSRGVPRETRTALTECTVRTQLGQTLLDAGVRFTVVAGVLYVDDGRGRFLAMFSQPWQVTA